MVLPPTWVCPHRSALPFAVPLPLRPFLLGDTHPQASKTACPWSFRVPLRCLLEGLLLPAAQSCCFITSHPLDATSLKSFLLPYPCMWCSFHTLIKPADFSPTISVAISLWHPVPVGWLSKPNCPRGRGPRPFSAYSFLLQNPHFTMAF